MKYEHYLEPERQHAIDIYCLLLTCKYSAVATANAYSECYQLGQTTEDDTSEAMVCWMKIKLSSFYKKIETALDTQLNR